jgi:DNA-binding MarR family transcriptional regulator
MVQPKIPRKPAAPRAVDTPVEGDRQGYVLEQQIGFVLRCVHQRATEIFNATMGRHGVTPTQFAVLAKLDDQDAVSQNQLGRLTAMDPATTSGVVGRLIARGFVSQAPDAQDARLVLLTLTAEGRAAVALMKTDAAEVSRRTLAPLSAAEAATLLKTLDKLR